MGTSAGRTGLAFVLAAAGWAGVCAGGAAVPAIRSLNAVRFETAPRLPPVRLVAGGKALATIVVRPVVDPREKGVPLKGYAGISCSVATAAEELQRYVKEATGALLPISAEMPPEGAVILVGRSEYTDRLKIRVDRLRPSGFVVARVGRGVAVVGRDANAKADWYAESGTLWGVYDFIERFLGVRWYYPGPLGTVVPRLEELTVPAVRYGDAPHFAKRRYGRFHGALRTPLPPSADMFPHVGAKYRNEDLAGIPVAAHTTRNWITLYGETHPEYFEVGRNGARVSGNLCYSQPGVLERFLENAADPKTTFVCVSPDDKPLECKCAACMKKVNAGDFLGEYSQVMGEFVARLGREVKKRWPDKVVVHLPYQNYTKPPVGVVFPDNVAVHICHTRPLPLYKEPRIYAEERAVIDGWKRALRRPIGHYHYVNTWPDDNTAAPFQYRHVMKTFFADHRDSFGTNNDGVLMFDWARHHLTTYLFMRLLWNPDYDVDAGFDEYCRLMYGAASEPMRGLLDLLNDRWERVRWEEPLPSYHFLNLKAVHAETYPPDVVKTMKSLFAAAAAAVPADSLERRRLDHFGRPLEAFFAESAAFHGEGDLKTLRALRVRDLPKLDGRLDDVCWTAAEAGVLVDAFDRNAPPPAVRTTVRCVWTPAALVLGFRLDEPDMAALVAKLAGRDNSVYLDDSVEIFLDPRGTRGDFFHIGVNSIPAIFDGRLSSNPYGRWDGEGIAAAVHKAADFWSVEVSIPGAAIGTEAFAPGMAWYVNFMRNRPGRGMYRFRTVDAPPKKTSHLNMAHFGRLVFVE